MIDHAQVLKSLGFKQFRIVGVRHFQDGKPSYAPTDPAPKTGPAANARTKEIVTKVLNSAKLVPITTFVEAGISSRTARTELERLIVDGLVVVKHERIRRRKLYGWAKK